MLWDTNQCGKIFKSHLHGSVAATNRVAVPWLGRCLFSWNLHTILCTSKSHPQILLILKLTKHYLLNPLDSELLVKKECVVFFFVSSMESTGINKQELWFMWFKQTKQSSPADCSNFRQYQLPDSH